MSRRQFRISRLMALVAGFGVLFALPSIASIPIACVTVTMLFGTFSASFIGRLTGAGPDRPDARENVPAMAQVAMALGLFAWVLLSVVGLRWQSPRFGTLAITVIILAVLIGSFAFVLALSALMVENRRRVFWWKVAAFFAMLYSVPFYVGMGLGLIWACILVFSGE